MKEPTFDFSKQEDQGKFDKLPEAVEGITTETKQDLVEIVDELVKLLSSDKIIDPMDVFDIQKKIKTQFPQSASEILKIPVIQAAATKSIEMFLVKGFVEDAVDIQEFVPITKEDLHKVAVSGIKANIIKGAPLIAKEICDEFSIPEKEFEQIMIVTIAEIIDTKGIDFARQRLQYILENSLIPENQIHQVVSEISSVYSTKGIHKEH
jgi:hypothetical protein